MSTVPNGAAADDLDAESSFYRRVLQALDDSGVPVLVGGAYAFAVYTGIERRTKDFDLFVRRDDYDRVAHVLEALGYPTELTFPHWLGKAHAGPWFVDLIFGSGNGVARVDDTWFEHAVAANVFDVPAKLVPVEEMIWSKAFVMERERFDGADIAHLLRARADTLDWSRLLARVGPNWRVLLGHLVLFGFVYPGERARIPAWVMRELLDRLRDEMIAPSVPDRLCRGTLISREQYLHDLRREGYVDARARPHGTMSAEDIATWTAAIDDATTNEGEK